MPDNLTDVLREFLNIDGVNAVAIVGRDGFVIDSVSTTKIDTDALGAVVASAIGASEAIGRDFAMGELQQYLLEFANGKAIIAAAGDGILALITDQSAVIGSVRYTVKRSLDRVVKHL